MTAKEYREKEQITDANFWDGDEIDFNMVYEFAEDYHSEQLRLHNVVRRSEQLVAFLEFIEGYKMLEVDLEYEEIVKRFVGN